MDREIEIVPALKRLELNHIGCWDELCMEFLPGLNIITDDYRGSGKSTILWAITRAVHPSAQMQYSITPTKGYPVGGIVVELMTTKIALSILESSVIPSFPAGTESMGTGTFELLKSRINTAPPGSALLLDADAINVLDEQYFPEAAQLLNESKSQIICVIAQRRLHPNLFRRARIYACFWDKEADRAGFRLQQSGGADG